MHGSSKPEPHPLAKIRLQLFDFDKTIEVAVVPDLSDDVLLGTDLGSRTIATWLLAAEDNAKTIKLTRAQAVAELEKSATDEVNLQASGDSPHLLQDIFDFSDSFFEEDPVNATASVNCNLPLPTPAVISDSSDRALLVEQQQSDPSLASITQLADKQERSYAYVNGLLVHYNQSKVDIPVRQVVLPQLRRANALKLAHDGDLGGHCGNYSACFVVLLGQILAVTLQNM